jgi:hypothetical protein
MDGSIIAMFRQVGQVARMVNVRVAEQHRIHLPRIKGKIAVASCGFFAMALVQATFQQQPFAVNFQ